MKKRIPKPKPSPRKGTLVMPVSQAVASTPAPKMLPAPRMKAVTKSGVSSATVFMAGPKDIHVGRKTLLAIWWTKLIGEHVGVPLLLAAILIGGFMKGGFWVTNVQANAQAGRIICNDPEVLQVRDKICNQWTCDMTQYTAELERIRIEGEIGRACGWDVKDFETQAQLARLDRLSYELSMAQ